MGRLVVQQFVSTDGFAADERGEFDLFEHVEGDPAVRARARRPAHQRAAQVRHLAVADRGAVLPVAIGSGRGVFPAGGPPLALRLLGSQTFDSLVAVDYAVGDGTQPSRG